MDTTEELDLSEGGYISPNTVSQPDSSRDVSRDRI